MMHAVLVQSTCLTTGLYVLLCLQALQGSGPGGRVIAQDVSVATPAVAAAPSPVVTPGE